MMKTRWLTGTLIVGLATPAAANPPTLYPNARRYAERNPSAATGRSGNATLTARALLSKATGTTLLDVTSGALDSGEPAPGVLTKVQVKGYDSAAEVAWTHNYTSGFTTGSAQYTYSSMLRGQAYQVQANLKGIDGKRTDVVTVSGSVKWRPDAKVAINAPDRAVVGSHVNIVALINEQLGDTGVTGDCVLYVDNVKADTTGAIWVDGGDAVSCAFTVAFDTLGTHTLRAAFENTVPGDDNTADNSAQRTIEIFANQNPISWSSYVYGNDYDHYRWRGTGWYQNTYYDGVSGGDWSYTYDYSENAWEEAYFSAWSNTRVRYPFELSFTQTSADQTLASFSTVGNPTWTWGDDSYGGSGFSQYDPAANAWLYFDEYHNDGYAQFSLYSHRYAGRATYFAQGYSRYWWRTSSGSSDNYYVVNGGSWQYGLVSTGPSIDSHLVLNDGGSVAYDVTAQVAVNRHRETYSQPWTCRDWNYYAGQNIGHECYEYSYDYQHWYDYASGELQ